MHRLLHKKGFTLVEMLLVIAIIAILVAVIVPTVTSSTTKAKAAADAANLRSVKAEIGIALLSNDTSTIPDASGGVITFTDGTKVTVPAAKAIGGDDESKLTFSAENTNGEVIVKYGTHTIADYAKYAEDGKTWTPCK